MKISTAIFVGVIYGVTCMSLIPLAKSDRAVHLAAEVGQFGPYH